MRIRPVAVVLLTAAALTTPAALAAGPIGRPPASAGFGIQLLRAPAPAPGNPLARVYIVDRLGAGATISRRVEISNSTHAIARIAVYAAAAGVRRGQFRFGGGHEPDELSRWTSVSRGTVEVPPGGEAFETVTVRVPKGASSGERYAVIWAEMSGPARPVSGVRLVNRVGVRMYVSVGRGGTRLSSARSFVVGSLRAERSAGGVPLVVAIVRNTGHRTLGIGGTLTLSRGPGGLRAPPVSVELAAPLAPEAAEQLKVPLDRALPRGPWHVVLRLGSGSIRRVAEGTVVFPPVFPRQARETSRSSASDLPVYVVLGLLGLLFAGASLFLVLRRHPVRPVR